MFESFWGRLRISKQSYQYFRGNVLIPWFNHALVDHEPSKYHKLYDCTQQVQSSMSTVYIILGLLEDKL